MPRQVQGHLSVELGELRETDWGRAATNAKYVEEGASRCMRWRIMLESTLGKSLSPVL
jgi:hypothetical protein